MNERTYRCPNCGAVKVIDFDGMTRGREAMVIRVCDVIRGRKK